MHHELSFRSHFLGKLFVCAAQVVHDTNSRLVDVVQFFELTGLVLSDENRLAKGEITVGHGHDFLTSVCDGNAAHGNVKLIGHRVGLQGLPSCRNIFEFDAEVLSQGLCHFCVKAFVFPGFFVEVAHRLVIAGRTD